MSHRVAVVLCTDHGNRSLLGLTLGERVLLALKYGGVDSVLFLGDGPRPQSDRAGLRILEWTDVRSDDQVFVVPSDAVFDKALLSQPQPLPEDLALGWMSVHTIQESDPVTVLDRLGAGRADSGRGFALRVTDRQTWDAAHRALLLSLRKPIDGIISRNLNRHISTFISRHLVRTGVSPNVLTLLFLGIGLLGAGCAYLAEPWWALVMAGLLFQAQSILDGCDGEIARLTYRFSHVGQWLDSVGDDITNYAFCLGLALGQARVTGYDWLFVMGCLTFGAQVLGSLVLYRRLVIMKTGDLLAIPNLLNEGDDPENPSLFARVSVLFKRDFFVFVIALITACQLPIFAFLLYSLGTFPTIYFVIVNDRKIARRDTLMQSK